MSISETAIAETPIAAGPASTTPIVGFPTYTIPLTSIKYRYGEHYVSEATNQKFLGIPRGVYLGFTASMTGNILKLSVDQDYGVSLLRVTSLLDTVAVDLLLTTDVTLDFTGQLVYPVYVFASVSEKLGSPSTAQIITAGAFVPSPTVSLICVLPSAGSVVFDAPTNRDTPYAYTGTPLGFGFMRANAVEQLLDAIDMITEVTNARTDLTSTVQASLGNRITVDGTAVNMATRLSRSIRSYRTSTFSVGGPITSANVSSQFSALYRSISPVTDIRPFGSSSYTGAVTGGSLPVPSPAGATQDSIRNVCVPVDASGVRLVDSTKVVYGRLIANEVTIAGTSSFSLGSPTVNGVGTAYNNGSIQAGDLIADAVGNLYVVLTTPVLPTVLTLSINAIAANAVVDTIRRRFSVDFVKSDDAGSEVAATVSQNFSLYFPVWHSSDIAVLDAQTFLYQNGAPVPVPVATSSLEGRVLRASGAPDGLAGALQVVKANNIAVGAGQFHTISFLAATNPGGGVVNVTMVGATGSKGPIPPGGGPAGPVGDPGLQGQGITTKNIFFLSGPYNQLVMPPSTLYSFSNTFGFDLIFVSGGLASWEVTSGGSNNDNDHFDIEDIIVTKPVPTGNFRTVTMNIRTPPPAGSGQFAILKFFMNVAGA